MSYERLEVERERDGTVLRVWLNRPEKRNALDQRALGEVGDLFRSLADDFETKVVVLAGRGLSFCGGADRREEAPPATSAREERYRSQLGRRAMRAVEECPIPTVARVHGHAIGGGSCLAVSCDFRVTADTAIWSVPEVELGLPLTWAATPRLIQEIGMARARQYILLAEGVDGATAEAWGLAHECVPEADLDAGVDRWVERLVALPDLAIDMAKSHFRSYAQAHALGDVTETDGDVLTVARGSDDFQQAFRRF
ncbi:MAG: enoyl-CoA hydratase/isomerase family protein [Actinomycetota bacterium]